MDLIRPEIRYAIWRFRDALIGGAVTLLGAYWALSSFGFVSVLGVFMIIAGAMLAVAGIQRGRFRSGRGGAGVVQVDEGEVTYFGPHYGGSVVIENIVKLELDSSNRLAPVWVVHDSVSGSIRIPTNAEGAEALFDVFAGLEGIETERMLAELEMAHQTPVVIWQARPSNLH